MKIFSFKLVLLFVTLCFSQTAFSAKNILVFGDSLSAGYGIALEQSWPSLLQKELARTRANFNVVNASISGETSIGGLQRIGKALKQHQPAIVIVGLGANDGLRGYNLADTERNLDKIIAQSKLSKAKVLLVGMQLPPNYGEAYTTKLRELYPRLANKHHILLLPFLLEGVAANQFQPDNLHPTADAQQHIMLNVLQELKHLLH